MAPADIRVIQGGEIAREALETPSAFIRSVTRLAERQEVTAKEDIYTHNGIKLVKRGARLSGRFYERLTAHRLLKPIEASIKVGDAPSTERVVALVQDEARRIPSLQPLLKTGAVKRLTRLLDGVCIPETLATQLAVMQQERPRLFRHSLLAAAIAVTLGIGEHLAQRELHALALASLLHDIGELYIDPDLLDSGRRLSMDERRHVYAHPITGYLLLREFADLPAGTAEAVLQHHERIDGAGYPRHLAGGSISKIARLLAVAEVTASLVERLGADRRIGMKFRMNMKKYDAQAVALVCRLFDETDVGADLSLDEQCLVDRLDQLGNLFRDWDALLDNCAPGDALTMQAIAERVGALRMMVLEPGYDHHRLGEILDLAGETDPEICMELTVLLDELTWQFGALYRAVERDHLVAGWHVPAAVRAMFDAWFHRVEEFIGPEYLPRMC